MSVLAHIATSRCTVYERQESPGPVFISYKISNQWSSEIKDGSQKNLKINYM